MLEMARRDQWRVDDLDWSVSPRPLSREHEIAICQYFTDMSGIELLAGELFKVQRDNARDPTLRAIFQTFVVDEARHAAVARRLVAHYDVHRYQKYELNPHLVGFRDHFVKAVRALPPDIANTYITTGELLLDIALLRSIDDFVDDDMSHQAMRLINRDESRHIAVDYHMAEYYSSAEYERWMDAQPKRRLRDRARGAVAFVGFVSHAQPFFRDVFFRPMELVDPEGKRLEEAFKRVQLLGRKDGSGRPRPFLRFLRMLQDLFEHSLGRRALGPAIQRITGVDPKVIRVLHTKEELSRAKTMSFDAMAEEALAAKGDRAA